MSTSRPTWTAADVGALLTAGPGDRIALASTTSTPARLAETLVALANTHGGVVVLGIGPNGKVQGTPDPENALATIRAAGLLSTPPLILPRPHSITLDDKTVCIAGSASRPAACLQHQRPLPIARAGAQNRLLSSAELTGLLLARDEAGFESRPAASATLADLDMTQVESYLAALAVPAGEEWQRTLLARGGLVGVVGVARSETGHSTEDGTTVARSETGHSTAGHSTAGHSTASHSTASRSTEDSLLPTYAGVLLFGRQPQRFLRNAQLSLVRYTGPTMGDEFLRHDATGTLPEQIRQAEAFVSANMRRGMRLSGFTRQETTEYPLSVVREAIVNAVAHRDYAIRGDSIRVLMFSDRLEIYSPGRLPGHVTLENLLVERFSRNEAIVQALSDLGFVERLGYGIDRMVAAMAEAGLPAPTFEETVAGFKVTLRGRGDDLVSAEPAPRSGQPALEPSPGTRPGPSG